MCPLYCSLYIVLLLWFRYFFCCIHPLPHLFHRSHHADVEWLTCGGLSRRYFNHGNVELRTLVHHPVTPMCTELIENQRCWMPRDIRSDDIIQPATHDALIHPPGR